MKSKLRGRRHSKAETPAQRERRRRKHMKRATKPQRVETKVRGMKSKVFARPGDSPAFNRPAPMPKAAALSPSMRNLS